MSSLLYNLEGVAQFGSILCSSRRLLFCSFKPVSLLKVCHLLSNGAGNGIMRGFSTRYWSNGLRMTNNMISSRPMLFSTAHVPMGTSRMMLPDDTNHMGNVHGGTILKLMEQTGHIVSMRHCNQSGNPGYQVNTVVARMEHTDFHLPMHVGDIAQVQGLVTFTSYRSLEVTCHVWAENLLTGSKRHTYSARLWYVAIPDLGRKFQPVSIPPLTGLSNEELDAGRKRYEAQKNARKLEEDMVYKEDVKNPQYQRYEVPDTASASFTTNTIAVLPSDCTLSGHMTGGAIMKIMDTAACICSIRHCKTPAVTVCLDAVNFHSPVFLGEIVLVTACVVFTSAKSMVIEVVCGAKGLRTNNHRVTNTAYFTFASIDELRQAQKVPQLKVISEEEKKKFSLMKQIYEKKKIKRIAEFKPSQ